MAGKNHTAQIESAGKIWQQKQQQTLNDPQENFKLI